MATTSRSTSVKANGNAAVAATSSDVEKELSNLRADIASLAETVQSLGAGKAHEVQRKAADATQDVAEAYEGALSSLRSEFENLEKDVSDRVQSNPLQAIGIAAGVGFLAALLTRK